MRNYTTRLLGLLAVCLFTASTANAAVIYLGSFNGNDSITGVNTAISNYNTANGGSFDLMTDKLAKWDCVKVGNVDCAGFSTTNEAISADLFDVTFDDATKKSGKWMFEGFENWMVGAFTVKAGSNYAVYLLNPPQSSVGTPGETWYTFNLFVGGGPNGPQNPKLSHLSWYGLQGEDPGCQQDCGGDEVPEPTLLALFGLGLLGAGAARRRAKR